ncbi:hypothetical protein BDQ17DRAFT_1353855 [Cyathus striatus]|nr:hypothetical protein BDQ17DRAFT_1353855 [Cyathus striatus]
MPSRTTESLPLHLDCEQLDPRHLDMRITSINLIVNYHKQGDCDERSELLKPTFPPHMHISLPEPPKANHFSDAYEEVVLDVIPSEVERFPRPKMTSDYRFALVAPPAMVRVRSIPKMHIERFAGHIYCELRIPQPITMHHIFGLMSEKDLFRYAFMPRNRQKSGCRHWIKVLASDMEDAGFTGMYFNSDIDLLMGYYYERGPMGNVVCVKEERVGRIQQGRYYNELRNGYIRFI